MEYSISNKSLLNQQIYLQVTKRIQNTGRKITLVGCGISVLVFTLWSCGSFCHQFYQILCLLLGCGVIAWAFLEYRVIAKRNFLRHKKDVEDGPLKFYTNFLEQELEITDPGGMRTRIAYETIKKIDLISEGLVICTDRRLGIFLDRNGYKTGNQKEAIAFLRWKCPHCFKKEGKQNEAAVSQSYDSDEGALYGSTEGGFQQF